MVTSMIPSVDNIFVNKSIVDMRFLSAYNPFINYTWEMLPNAKVKNSGTSGVDLQLYSGNPLDFQATQGIQVNKSFTLSGNAISLYLGFDTDSIAITHTLAEFDNLKVSIVNATLKVTINAVEHNVATIALNTYYQTEIVINSNNLTVKLNGTQTYSASCTALNTTILKSVGANDGLASGRFDGQLDYFIVYNGLTTFSLPNQFFKDMSTDVNTLFCTDFGGNSGYVADDRNVSVGSDIFETEIKPLKSLSIYSGSGTADYTTDDFAHYVTNGGHVRVSYDDINISLKNYDYFLIETEIRNYISGGFKWIFDGDGVPVTPHMSSDGIYYHIVKSASDVDRIQTFPTSIDETIPMDLEYRVNQIVSLSNIYPITNYSATQRTNFTQVNKGLQDLTRSFDSNGFFVDNVSYLNCNGKGYGDTDWIPSASENWTIELVIDYKATGLYQYVGVRAVPNTQVYIGLSNYSRVFALVGNVGIQGPIVYLDGMISLVLIYNAEIKTFSLYENKILTTANKATPNFTTGLYSFYLGYHNQATAFQMTSPITKFKVHNKALTNEEIQKL